MFAFSVSFSNTVLLALFNFSEPHYIDLYVCVCVCVCFPCMNIKLVDIVARRRFSAILFVCQLISDTASQY